MSLHSVQALLERMNKTFVGTMAKQRELDRASFQPSYIDRLRHLKNGGPLGGMTSPIYYHKHTYII